MSALHRASHPWSTYQNKAYVKVFLWHFLQCKSVLTGHQVWCRSSCKTTSHNQEVQTCAINSRNPESSLTSSPIDTAVVWLVSSLYSFCFSPAHAQMSDGRTAGKHVSHLNTLQWMFIISSLLRHESGLEPNWLKLDIRQDSRSQPADRPEMAGTQQFSSYKNIKWEWRRLAYLYSCQWLAGPK